MGRPKTTGIYNTREELVNYILECSAIQMAWTAIARRTGVSITTVGNIIFHPEKR